LTTRAPGGSEGDAHELTGWAEGLAEARRRAGRLTGNAQAAQDTTAPKGYTSAADGIAEARRRRGGTAS
jgi:hypothetical protein